MTPRLSICIPTYNRASVLEKTLESITANPVFAAASDIEVVVSDNASTDNTEEVVARFAALHQDRVRYFRNTTNVFDQNFEIALRQGRGTFLKLANDSLCWSPEGLAHVHELIGACEKIKPVLFFLNGARPTPDPVLVVQKPDELLAAASFQLTWIGAFGIWREHLERLHDFSRCADRQLLQVDAICRLVKMGRPIVVSNIQFGRVVDVGRKGGYSLAKVFGVNFLGILNSFHEVFSAAALAQVKRSVLIEHILPWHFNPDHDFGAFPLEEYLDDLYGEEPYYREALLAARPHRVEQTRDTLTPQQLPQAWRMRNSHNDTYMVRVFDIDRVSVGKASYGPLDVRTWDHPDERLQIGHYVSIAEGVIFLLGGNHPYKGFSTYPFKVKLLGHAREAQTKGPITVGDDVWIGTNAMILSGVRIGQGAIIGAGSVITSDVPPYAIVAGNPGHVVRYRFSETVIAKLLQLDFGSLHPETLALCADSLYDELTDSNVDGALKKLRRAPVGSVVDTH